MMIQYRTDHRLCYGGPRRGMTRADGSDRHGGDHVDSGNSGRYGKYVITQPRLLTELAHHDFTNVPVSPSR
jgi:hypothetical protein